MFTVIEGLDGSGKSTQVRLLEAYLSEHGKDFLHIKLPDYESNSSALVKMYLAGEFGSNAADVNVYAASAFYAVDRFANFVIKWKSAYECGKDIIADRYTTSNAIYQLAKLDKSRWDAYLEWLSDFEYNKMGIPNPDKVIYLDMPVDISQKLMSKRYAGDESKKDVHEKNIAFLERCREAALYTAKKWNWLVIACAAGDAPRSREEIHSEILSAFVAR
ncbi:MAG: thymidylate kinase [Ruminococcaceae bacterium]|nr:thymidylate kinase [Oscillospiraceae bacterium]